MGVFRTIFIIILIYYGFKFVARFLMPFLLRFFVNKAQQNMQDRFQQEEPQRPEGEVNIKQPNKKNTNHNTNALDVEDVDFEEVD